jgi:hypothetical protein
MTKPNLDFITLSALLAPASGPHRAFRPIFASFENSLTGRVTKKSSNNANKANKAKKA